MAKLFWIILIVLVIGGWFLYSQDEPEIINITPPPPSSTSTPVSFFDTEYVTAPDWPPKIQVEKSPFTCTVAGSSTARAGSTTRKTINNKSYCVTEVQEGAAGSVYTQYAYAYASGTSTTILTFSIREVQCDNYDEPKKSECKAEQASFDVDALVSDTVR